MPTKIKNQVKQAKRKRKYSKSPNTKMVSQRYTKKMSYEVEQASNILGLPMTQIVAMGIEKIYQQALKNEKSTTTIN